GPGLLRSRSDRVRRGRARGGGVRAAVVQPGRAAGARAADAREPGPRSPPRARAGAAPRPAAGRPVAAGMVERGPAVRRQRHATRRDGVVESSLGLGGGTASDGADARGAVGCPRGTRRPAWSPRGRRRNALLGGASAGTSRSAAVSPFTLQRDVDVHRASWWREGETPDWAPLVEREWLVTNGLGGYASSTVLGAATRR